jgi:D-alanyl-lipoteichoic acid acyltransferase DltB (MBOAT superfamily)
MLFNSFQFLIFFPVVVTVFFALPDRWRNIFLLIASYYFYMCWRPAYIIVIWFITILDYWAGMKIEEAQDDRVRRFFLGLSIVGNFGLLFVFKYFNFFGGTINQALRPLRLFGDIPLLHLMLPIGLSFHTFQAVSYTIEVYRRRVPAQRNLLHYALYVAFFPQMVAGPIERPYHLLPQFKKHKRVEFEAVRFGLELAMWGFFKKVVIADRLAAMVNTVYQSPKTFSGPLLTLATVFFAIQIYCDFSGYSDIAIGCARIMGFDLMTNFRQPYFAQSIEEFWHRWHISLSTWFRDYLYIPLGGNRVSDARWCANILIVFTVSGLWHGANWTFVAWGALHGIFYLVGNATSEARESIARMLGDLNMPRLRQARRMLFTFGLTTIAWVFFRANSLGDATYVLTHFFRIGNFRLADLNLFSIGIDRSDLLIATVMIGVVGLVDWQLANSDGIARKIWNVKPLRWSLYYACLYSIVFFGVFEHLEFIYFRF